jgi:four helix bundle protein
MATTSVEDLEVFKLAHARVLQVYTATRTFPREETFGLATQLRRAAASVGANLVEDAGRLNRAEYRQFVSKEEGRS